MGGGNVETGKTTRSYVGLYTLEGLEAEAYTASQYPCRLCSPSRTRLEASIFVVNCFRYVCLIYVAMHRCYDVFLRLVTNKFS